MTRDILTSGTVLLTVVPAETFVLTRKLLGDDFHSRYEFRIERVEGDGSPVFFIQARTNGRWVYMGVVNPVKGCIRLTKKSAFPAHATRVRVADRVCQALCAGRADAIEAAGWAVECEVVAEVANRF